MSKDKQKDPNQKIYMADSFVHVPDMKCSFFILQPIEEKDKESIVIKLDDGRYKDIIVKISDFNFPNDNNSMLNFNYEVIHNPYKKIANAKNFEIIVKGVVKKIINLALKTAEELERSQKQVEVKKKTTK